MLRSHAKTLVSVRRVAQLNAGRKTAGIDGKTALLPQEKTDLVAWVQRESSSWTPRAVKRVFIPNAGGKQRPLGIPTDASYCPSCNRVLGSSARVGVGRVWLNGMVPGGTRHFPVSGPRSGLGAEGCGVDVSGVGDAVP